MKQISDYITEKFKINSKTASNKVDLDDIKDKLEKNFDSETKLESKYVDINVVTNLEKTEEWIQISTGVYKDDKKTQIIIEYVEKLLKDINVKYEISFKHYTLTTLINIYI